MRMTPEGQDQDCVTRWSSVCMVGDGCTEMPNRCAFAESSFVEHIYILSEYGVFNVLLGWIRLRELRYVSICSEVIL